MTTAEARVEQWNATVAVGQPVDWWTLMDRSGERRTSATRSKAWLLSSGEPVVLVEGLSGGLHLDCVQPHSSHVEWLHAQLAETNRLFVNSVQALRDQVDAMQPVVDAAVLLAGAWLAAEEDDDWEDEPFARLSHEFVKAAKAYAARTEPAAWHEGWENLLADGHPYLDEPVGCPDCGTILNAQAANCTSYWHQADRERQEIPT